MAHICILIFSLGLFLLYFKYKLFFSVGFTLSVILKVLLILIHQEAMPAKGSSNLLYTYRQLHIFILKKVTQRPALKRAATKVAALFKNINTYNQISIPGFVEF